MTFLLALKPTGLELSALARLLLLLGFTSLDESLRVLPQVSFSLFEDAPEDNSSAATNPSTSSAETSDETTTSSSAGPEAAGTPPIKQILMKFPPGTDKREIARAMSNNEETVRVSAMPDVSTGAGLPQASNLQNPSGTLSTGNNSNNPTALPPSQRPRNHIQLGADVNLNVGRNPNAMQQNLQEKIAVRGPKKPTRPADMLFSDAPGGSGSVSAGTESEKAKPKGLNFSMKKKRALFFRDPEGNVTIAPGKNGELDLHALRGEKQFQEAPDAAMEATRSPEAKAKFEQEHDIIETGVDLMTFTRDYVGFGGEWDAKRFQQSLNQGTSDAKKALMIMYSREWGKHGLFASIMAPGFRMGRKAVKELPRRGVAEEEF